MAKTSAPKIEPGFGNIFRPIDTVCSLLSKVCFSRSSHLATSLGEHQSVNLRTLPKRRADRKLESVSQTFRSESIDKQAVHTLSNRLITHRTRATLTHSLPYSNQTHTRALGWMFTFCRRRSRHRVTSSRAPRTNTPAALIWFLYYG